MFATASLAARIERAECTMLTEIAQAAIKNRGPGSVVLDPVAGGVATFVAPGSPVNKFAGLGFEVGLEMVEKLKPLVPAGYTLPQLALRWCLDHPAVTTIIPGARNRTQAEANAAASDLPALPAETHAKLRECFFRDVKPAVRGPD